MRTEPVRTCIGCRRTASKCGLVRLVRRSDGQVIVDRLSREAGRGAYLCPGPECLEAALKRGALARAFRRPARVGPETLAFLAPARERLLAPARERLLAPARERLLQSRIEPASVSSARAGGPGTRAEGVGAGRDMKEVRK